MRKFEMRLDLTDTVFGTTYGVAVIEAETLADAVQKARAGRPDVTGVTVLCSIDLEPQVPLVRLA